MYESGNGMKLKSKAKRDKNFHIKNVFSNEINTLYI